jgi:hypothetical protein
LDDYNKEVEEAATLLLWLEHGWVSLKALAECV